MVVSLKKYDSVCEPENTKKKLLCLPTGIKYKNWKERKRNEKSKNPKIQIKSKTGREYSIYDYTENYKYMKYTYLKYGTV